MVRAMKLVAECLERVAHFQRLAETAKDPAVQEQLLEQAEAYYTLALNLADIGHGASTATERAGLVASLIASSR